MQLLVLVVQARVRTQSAVQRSNFVSDRLFLVRMTESAARWPQTNRRCVIIKNHFTVKSVVVNEESEAAVLWSRILHSLIFQLRGYVLQLVNMSSRAIHTSVYRMYRISGQIS